MINIINGGTLKFLDMGIPSPPTRATFFDLYYFG